MYVNRRLKVCNCRVVGLGLIRMALGQMCTRVIWTRIGQDLGTRRFAPAVCHLICGACELSWRHCYNLWSCQGLHRTKGADVPNSWSLIYVAYQWWFGLSSAGHSSFCKLDSVLLPPSINQIPPEASQQGISERECAEIRAGTGQREADKTL